ncbi:hypothetical protein M0R45_006553 [Rubus argutus]|uniref:Uncharacterized protein n=1 Tax=Rubus argutus TaxID=59490 RepID=A0AAW1YQV1_RUBAR
MCSTEDRRRRRGFGDHGVASALERRRRWFDLFCFHSPHFSITGRGERRLRAGLGLGTANGALRLTVAESDGSSADEAVVESCGVRCGLKDGFCDDDCRCWSSGLDLMKVNRWWLGQWLWSEVAFAMKAEGTGCDYGIAASLG